MTSSEVPAAAAAEPVSPATPAARIWLVAGGGWVGRGVQVAAQLVSIRILTDSLGTDGYGAFAVLASLVGWLALADFSIAVSVQNYLSERRAAGEPADDVIVTGAALSVGAAVLVAAIALLAGPWLAGMLLGNFSFLSPSERTLAFFAMVLPGIGAALGNVGYRIWFAQHRGYLSNLLPAAGTVLGTAGIWVLARIQPPNALAWNTFVFYAPLAVLALGSLAGLTRTALRRQVLRADLIKPILRRSSSFWLFGIAAALVLQVDYIIIAQVLPPQDIVVYNITSKIFALVFFVYTALLQAIWPVCSEAIARDDWAHVFSTTRKYLAIGIGFALVCGAGFLLVNRLIVALIAPTLGAPIPSVVVVLFTIYIAIRIWTDTFGMVLQSMNYLRVFWIAVPLQAMLSIGLQIAGARLFGLPGVIIALSLCFVLTVAWILPITCLRLARSRTGSLKAG
jgi:O-antigen/teichoic acid export membrane protein